VALTAGIHQLQRVALPPAGPKKAVEPVLADIRAPTLGAPSQTLLRWHPTLPAQLFVARGATVLLVDLAGELGDGEWDA
jgi:hypothetical protein